VREGRGNRGGSHWKEGEGAEGGEEMKGRVQVEARGKRSREDEGRSVPLFEQNISRSSLRDCFSVTPTLS
jgi:hypothetical protein